MASVDFGFLHDVLVSLCAPSGQPALAPLPDSVHGQLDGKL